MNKHIIKARGPVRNFYEIIIPAAGIGKRMKTYGPKALIEINNQTIIQNQLKIINDTFPHCRIILVCGFQAEKLMNNTPNNIIKVENSSYEESNVVRSIGVGLRATITDNVVIIYGDLIFNKAALNIRFDESSLITDQSSSMSQEEVGCIVNEGIVESMCYDLPLKWGQIMYLNGKELRLMKEYCYNKNNSKMFGFEAINYVIGLGGKFKVATPSNAYIIDIDTSKDIEKAKELL